MDRIDIHVEVDGVSYEDLRDKKASGETSAAVRARVNKARQIQRNRFADSKTKCNAKMDSKQVAKYCVLDEDSSKLLKEAFEAFNLTARSYNRILKVARTIADLDGAENIGVSHIAEALSYRTLDKKYWV